MADSEYLDDYEQAEQVKKWLRENALALIVGVGGGLALLFGWQWWENHQQETRIANARAYESFLEGEAQSLPAELADTSYAGFAQLRLAKVAVDAGELERAAELLSAARLNAEPEPLRDVATLRLARVRIAQGDADGALALTEAYAEGPFAGMAAHMRGDALLLKGDAAAAREAYLAAMEALGPGADRNLVQMKVDDLPAESS